MIDLRRGFVGAGGLAVSQGASTLLSFVIIGLSARYLTPNVFGTYYSFLSTVVLLNLLSDFGLTYVVVRESVRQPDNTSALVSGALLLRGAFGVAAIAVAAAWLAAHGTSPGRMVAFVMIASTTVTGGIATVLSSLMNVELDFFRLGWYRLVERLAFLAFLWPVTYLDLGLVGVAGVHVLASLLGGIPFLLHARTRFSWSFRVPFRQLFSLLGSSVWFALAGIFGFLFGRASILVGAARLPAPELAAYSASFSLADQSLIVVSSLATAFYPMMTSAFAKGPLAPVKVLRSMAVLGAVSIPPALVVAWFANPIVVLIFGEQYAAAGPLLAILIWSFPIFMMTIPSSLAAESTSFQRLHAVNGAYMVGIGVILMLLLSKSMGSVGLAIAVVIARASGLIIGGPLILITLMRKGILASPKPDA